MKKVKEIKEYGKIRAIRMSDKTWEQFQCMAQEGVSWDKSISDFLKIVKELHDYFK